MRLKFWHCALLGLALAPCAIAEAADLPADVTLTQVATGLSAPTALASPADGTDRLFVLESSTGQGRIRIIENGSLLATPYWSHAITGGPWDEQGILGLAFDPDFATNGTLYVTYTAPGSDPKLGAQPDQVLMRLTASDPAVNIFTGDETVVLRIPDIYWNHNGGNIVFGPDGYLYWGMGDGGSGGDPNDFSQELWKKTVSGKSYYLLGKMMRLDVRNPTASAATNQCGASAGQPAEYSIPADNPFAGDAQKCGEIWLYGLRNPWRWSFDRATGDLVIGDVGQNAWEEIDFRAWGDAGNRNYGWKLCEGNHYYSPSGPGTTCPATTGTVGAVIEYSHSLGSSVTGGYIYRGPVASLRGLYLFGDAYRAQVWVATPDTESATWAYSINGGPAGTNVYSYGEDDVGNLYLIDGGGKIFRFDGDVPPGAVTVTPETEGAGVIMPFRAMPASPGEVLEFTLAPADGYSLDAVTGCGGSLAGLVYTTAPVTTDCTVKASFTEGGDVIFRNGFESPFSGGPRD